MAFLAVKRMVNPPYSCQESDHEVGQDRFVSALGVFNPQCFALGTPNCIAEQPLSRVPLHQQTIGSLELTNWDLEAHDRRLGFEPQFFEEQLVMKFGLNAVNSQALLDRLGGAAGGE